MEPILINIAKELDAQRYNGGWTKTVTGLDKQKSNGYSICGDFVRAGLFPCQPGLYLDCGIGGSRKNRVSFYQLVELHPDGTLTHVVEPFRGGADWAVTLWPAIDKWFADQADKRAEQERAAEAMVTSAVPFRDEEGNVVPIEPGVICDLIADIASDLTDYTMTAAQYRTETADPALCAKLNAILAMMERWSRDITALE